MKKTLLTIGILTYAIWETLLLVVIHYVLTNLITPLITEAEKPNITFLLLIHIILLLVSAYPIFIWKKQIGLKVLLLIVHYLFAAIFTFCIYYFGLVGIYGWNN
jgi:hypothetical protein